MLTNRDICKILNFLGKYGIGDTSDLENRLSAIESIISDENDTSETIDKFNEIVEFLNDILNTENLKEILNNKADLTDLEELTTLLNGKLSADALYAGAAVQGGAANKAVSIPFGQVDSTSTSTAFNATVDGITELRDGVCVYLKNGVVSSASGCTLNINGLGAKPIYSTMVNAGLITTLFDVAYTMLFVYNSSRVSGGCWDMYYGYNSDTNTIGYDVREYYLGSKKVKAETPRYQILLSTFDGMLLPTYSGTYTTETTKVLITDKFNPLGQVYYYHSTAVVAANAVIPNYTLFSQATNTQIDLRYSFNCGSTLVAGDDVYLVCVPQSDGSAVLHSNPLAFALPTTEDGLLYKRLGKCYDTYRIILEQHKPVYYYKDGGIREWTGNTIPTELTDYSFTKKSVTQNGKVEIKNIGGDTVVWNQNFQNGQTNTGTQWNTDGTSIPKDFSDETRYEYDTEANGAVYNSIPVGHKAYYAITLKADSITDGSLRSSVRNHNIVVTIDSTNLLNYKKVIDTIKEEDTYYTLRSFTNFTATGVVISINIIDLTLMFGAGNEPSTVEEFEEWLTTHVGDSEYYSYNAGELISVKAQGIQNGTETHNLDITILTGKLNGEGSSVTIFPDGLKKAGSVYDEIKVDNGVVKAVKRIGVVDLGTLTWYYGATYNLFYAYLVDAKNGATSKGSNYICIKYDLAKNATYTRWADYPDKHISAGSSYIGGSQEQSIVTVKDTSYSDTATFKAAMSGVILYYELATPEEYILDNQSYLPLSYTEEKGSETILLPVNGDTPTHIAPRMNVRVSGEDEWVEEKIKNTYSKDEVDNGFAVKEGTEERLVTGISNSLSGVSESGGEPFTFIKSSGSDAMSKMGSVRGNSLVWNQLVQNGNFDGTSYWTPTYGTITTSNNECKYVVTTVGTSAQNRISNPGDFSLDIISGHKYFVAMSAKLPYNAKFGITAYSSSNAAITIAMTELETGSTGVYVKGSAIVSATNSGPSDLRFYVDTFSDKAVNDEYYFKNINFIDLTLMFGSGNEPSTVAEFESLFPLPYYGYNAGVIISNNTEKVRLTGFNQWDEEWEGGGISTSTGGTIANGNAIRSKNFIPVLPNTTYYLCIPTKATYLHTYDASYNWISMLIDGSSNSQTFNTPDKCAYLKFQVGYSGGSLTTYNHDICINISDTSRNGIYMPYQTSDIDLNLNTLTGKLNGEGESVVVFPDGMKSAGSVRDEIVGNKAIKRVGVVDLGTLTWNNTSTANRYYASLPVDSRAYTISIPMNYLIKKYNKQSTLSNLADKEICLDNQSYCYIQDSSYSDAATFKTAMSGVLLYYQLATPEEYILDNPLRETFQSYKGGTLQQIPENGSAPVTAPNVMSVIYSLNADDLVTKQMFEAIPLGDGGLAPIIETTYSELVSLRNRMKLVPGLFYRITDYVTTVNQYTEPNARSAGHPFDIIVFAEANNTLSETAHAILHDGDAYFNNSNIEAWELRYRLDNVQWSEQKGTYMICSDGDASYTLTKAGTVKIGGTTYILWKGDVAFTEDWIDYAVSYDEEEGTSVYAYYGDDEEPSDEAGNIESVNVVTEEGKGTIIWMKDEFGNECPYDFKNVQFKRWLCTDGRDGRDGLDGLYMVANPNILPQDLTVDDEEDFIWAFTFSSGNSGGEQEDYSLGGHNVHDNVFKPKSDGSLANNVMFGEHNYANSFGVDCYDNSWGNYCYNNSWGNSCGNNSWGNYCYSNSWGNSCGNNSWGNSCGNNSWGNYCYSNSWGNDCYYNSWGNSCRRNSWGNNCYDNSWGNSCYDNSWGNSCYDNSWGNGCNNNSWGNDCDNNSWGNNCFSNSWGNEVTYTTVFDGVQYTQITTEKVKYAQVLNGVAGTSSSKLTLNFAANANYTQVACLNSSGQLKIYVPGDLVQ